MTAWTLIFLACWGYSSNSDCVIVRRYELASRPACLVVAVALRAELRRDGATVFWPECLQG